MNPEPTHRSDEPDIGSGEKNKGQRETEQMISQVNNQKKPGESGQEGMARPTGPAQPADNPGDRT